MDTVPGKRNLSAVFMVLSFFMMLGALFSLVQGKKTVLSPPSARTSATSASQDQQLQKFSLVGFDDKGKKFWNLEGDTAKIDPTQQIFLDQNVTLRLKDDTVIRTDHVRWIQGGGVLKTTAPVFVNHQNVKIKGVGAYGKPSESFIQLNRHIEMVINPATTLTCDGPMKIFYKENKIVFYRNVKVKDQRGVLSANRMDVFFNSEDKKINQIVAMGSVVIERGTDTTRSQRAIYSVATGSIRLEGNPEVTLHKEGSNILDAALRS